MKKFVILGSSAAAVHMIEQIRAHDQASEIVVFSLDGHYPYRRDFCASLLAKTIAADAVFPATKDFYDRNNVRVVLDKRISRLNTKRNAIFTEDKDQIDYDYLFVTDTPENRYPNVKGTTKGRIFGFKRIADIELLSKELPLIETAAVHSGSFRGLQAAAAIAAREKEALVVASGDDFISSHFDGEVVVWLTERLHEAGIHVILGNPLSEILGDKDAKAIRLQSGKVYATDINIFPDMDEDLRLFAGSDLKAGRGIIVDRNFRSNITNIFALDQAATARQTDMADEAPNLPEILRCQAKTVVGAIFGPEVPFEMPVLSQTVQGDGFDLTVIGQTARFPDIEVRRTFEPEASRYKALYLRDNRVAGAILINAQSQVPAILEMISNKTPVPAVDAGGAQEDTAGTSPDTADGQSVAVSAEVIDS